MLASPVRIQFNARQVVAMATFLLCLANATAASPGLLQLPEGKLAAIDAGTRDISDARIKPYREVLDTLQLRCEESRERIGDFAVTGVNMLKSQKGVSVSIFGFLERMKGAIPDRVSPHGIRCMEIAAALVTLTGK